MRGRAQTISAITAVLLVGLVLATFAALQNYGPGSTLRRFHSAILRKDVGELAKSIDVPPESTGARLLADQAAVLMGRQGQYRLARMERLPREVRAVIEYQPRPGLRQAMVWVVAQRKGVWRIDTGRTLAVLRESAGF